MQSLLDGKVIGTLDPSSVPHWNTALVQPPPPQTHTEYSTPYSTPAGGQSLVEEEPPVPDSPSMGQLTVSPVSAGYTAYLDSYMEPRLSAGQAATPHVRLAGYPAKSPHPHTTAAGGGQGYSHRSSHYSCKSDWDPPSNTLCLAIPSSPLSFHCCGFVRFVLPHFDYLKNCLHSPHELSMLWHTLTLGFP